MRLDKYLTDCGIDSRSNCKKYIRQGRVTVNDRVEKNEARHVSDADNICFDNTPVVLKSGLYLMFYKPSGCVCALRDAMHQTVIDYFPDDYKKRLLIAGRLDKDTEGILFLTDDGAFIHHLMSPKKHVDKTYYFEAEGRLDPQAVEIAAKGMDIGDDTPLKPAKLEILTNDTVRSSGMLTICEGRYHQVKRMVHLLGAEVVRLKRLAIGSISLDEALEPGQFRALTDSELEALHYKIEK